MYCSKCGMQIADDLTICPKCNYVIGDINMSTNSGTDNEEIIVLEGLCNRVKSILYVQNGHGLLTNKRFIYGKHSLGKILAIGLAVNLTKGKYEFDIPIREIDSIEDGRQGVSKTIIINTKTGERYNFYFSNREKWLKAFNDLM